MLMEYNAPQNAKNPQEGDLYRVVTTFGKTFELRYGYYDEKDRQSPLCAPAVLYPDFLKTPVFTETGEAFVTLMQDACDFYQGIEPRTADTTCADCKHMARGKEWFGVCICFANRKNNERN